MEYNFKGIICEDKDNSLKWNYRIIIPKEIMSIFLKTDKRVICTINSSSPFHCALISNGKGDYFLFKGHKLSYWEISVQLTVPAYVATMLPKRYAGL